jgi:hypothetical protein
MAPAQLASPYANPSSIATCSAVFAADRVEIFDFPLSTIEMVLDESQNLDETALGQSQYRDERAPDESRN